MTLEEAVNQLTPEQRTAINTVGKTEIGVKKLPYATEKPYTTFYAIDPTTPSAFNGRFLGEYSSLEEAKNCFVVLPFASSIDPNGWSVSPERG